MYEQKSKKNLVKLLNLSRVDLFVLTIGSIQQLFRHPSLLPIEVFTATQKHENKGRGRPGRQKQQSVNHPLRGVGLKEKKNNNKDTKHSYAKVNNQRQKKNKS